MSVAYFRATSSVVCLKTPASTHTHTHTNTHTRTTQFYTYMNTVYGTDFYTRVHIYCMYINVHIEQFELVHMFELRNSPEFHPNSAIVLSVVATKKMINAVSMSMTRAGLWSAMIAD